MKDAKELSALEQLVRNDERLILAFVIDAVLYVSLRE